MQHCSPHLTVVHLHTLTLLLFSNPRILFFRAAGLLKVDHLAAHLSIFFPSYSWWARWLFMLIVSELLCQQMQTSNDPVLIRTVGWWKSVNRTDGERTAVRVQEATCGDHTLFFFFWKTKAGVEQFEVLEAEYRADLNPTAANVRTSWEENQLLPSSVVSISGSELVSGVKLWVFKVLGKECLKKLYVVTKQ